MGCKEWKSNSNEYIYILQQQKHVINDNCLSFNIPFLASKKGSQGVISRI